ncbi:MAG: 6,7-dimethyl-8-ribityllumazine synthase [Candidatus Marinimicrobia bacterium]|nr:6,7-dimethyl-8-ribityllumazine synthase [Candidatus Neomarinimicrobiota bacterium]MCF7828893.1 6,7-dimethyl-8-ribityllumazine synthase [Candidatus Neomarinimicrobiota bacterium]MCF7879853.1 6,7-dimethyl-8-ribityllumazine synthase [Candidatus Neomarinimicrobiota bacterium]
MAKVHEGQLDAKGRRIAVVVGRFNELVSSKLVQGAKDCFLRHGGAEEDFEIYWVPGSYEIPYTAKQVANLEKFDAIVCLGAVIRGGTPHFDYIASEAAKGVAQVGLDSPIPVIFGILTTDTVEQAIERAGTKAGNKGWDAALTAVEMINLQSEHL